MPTVNGHDADFGCYVDGHYGQYATDRLADVCDSFDVSLDAGPKRSVLNDPRFLRELIAELELMTSDTDLINRLWEWHHESSDRMIDYLNERTVGGVWHWYEGEVFLSRICDLDEGTCDDEECFHAWP